MNSNILEDIQRVNKLIEANQGELTIEIENERKIVMAKLEGFVMATENMYGRLEGLRKNISMDLNEYLVMRDLFVGKRKQKSRD
jgi:hypothetical protein